MRIAVFLLFAISAGSAAAESFLLKTGGRIEGTLLNPERTLSEPYRVKTESGLMLSLAKDAVAKYIPQRDAEKDYEKILPRMPDTAEGHWKMAEWCREASLKPEREHHLREVIERDPDHKQARIALGYFQYEGKWEREEEYMTRQGYVRVNGKWSTRQEADMLKGSSSTEDAALEWRKKIRLWRAWTKSERKAEEAHRLLRAVRDPRAAPAIIEILDDKETAFTLKLELMEILAAMPGRPGELIFVKYAMRNEDDDLGRLREKAVTLLEQSGAKYLASRFEPFLAGGNNTLINRGAYVLGRLKSEESTLKLIDVLVTVHEEVIHPGTAPGGIGAGFNKDGGGSFSSGGQKPIKRKVAKNNESVLSALTAIHPGVNFAFDVQAWKGWYERKNQPIGIDLRRGE